MAGIVNGRYTCMDLPKSKMGHVTNVTLGVPEVCRYLDSYMAIDGFVERGQTLVNSQFSRDCHPMSSNMFENIGPYLDPNRFTL